MNVPSFIEIENLLKTLPVGYYIGRNVPLKLTNENSSYYIPMKDEAYISYPCLQETMSKIKASLTSEEVECLTRTLVYHEISHAFITPTSLEINHVINVFEDERIETICRHYYKNVNFKKLLMLVNNWDGHSVVPVYSKDTAWFSLIRFHKGPEYLLKKAARILDEYKYLNRNSNADWYYTDVMALYSDICISDFENTSSDAPKDDTSKDDTSKDDESKETTNTTTIVDGAEYNEDEDEVDNFDSDEFSNVILNDEDCKKLFESSQFFDNDIQNHINAIITVNKKVTKANASAINAYSGVFNAKSVVRDDYKWFVQQNRLGNVKQFSKIKLNLFIDNSGSFRHNEKIVNKLLFTLSKLEKSNKDFSFDMITMNTEFILKNKDERELHCFGGNRIPNNAITIFNQVQDKHASTYNIVLFDGDALSDEWSRTRGPQFKVFDKPNLVLISDYSNAEYADEYCTSAKRIYTKEYAKELINQVYVALTFLLK